jgi:NAD(P)-dependent dehydrogenase (short-subunit alcohol dehydrogenase family)
MRLEGLKVLITGGASGLGAATATRFAQASCKVAIWDVNVEAGKRKAEEIGGLFYQTDLGCQDSIKASFAQTLRDLGRTDVVVNCAAVALLAPVIGTPIDELMTVFDKTMRINTFGSYLVNVLAAQQMEKQTEIDGERGVIINVSSIFAKYGEFFASAYAASKGAISGMNLALARDFSTAKIRLNAIAPGYFETPMVRFASAEMKEFLKLQTTTLTAGDPSQFAHFVQAIVENKYISGSVLPLDAGLIFPNLKAMA